MPAGLYRRRVRWHAQPPGQRDDRCPRRCASRRPCPSARASGASPAHGPRLRPRASGRGRGPSSSTVPSAITPSSEYCWRGTCPRARWRWRRPRRPRSAISATSSLGGADVRSQRRSSARMDESWRGSAGSSRRKRSASGGLCRASRATSSAIAPVGTRRRARGRRARSGRTSAPSAATASRAKPSSSSSPGRSTRPSVYSSTVAPSGSARCPPRRTGNGITPAAPTRAPPGTTCDAVVGQHQRRRMAGVHPGHVSRPGVDHHVEQRRHLAVAGLGPHRAGSGATPPSAGSWPSSAYARRRASQPADHRRGGQALAGHVAHHQAHPAARRWGSRRTSRHPPRPRWRPGR